MAIVTGYATLNTMRKDSEQQAKELLQVASNILEQTFKTRQDQLAASVRLLTSDFGFRQAIATAEEATILSVLENHGARIDADLAFLFAPDGRVLATTTSATDDSLLEVVFQQAQSQLQRQSFILAVENQAYQIIVVPVRSPHLVAWVGMGFRINGQLAQQLKALTLHDVSFLLSQSATPQLLTSTLLNEPMQQYREHIKVNHDVFYQQVIDTPINFISKSLPLDQVQNVWAVLHLPNERWLSNYVQLRLQLFRIFGLGLALVLIVAFIYAHSITKPLTKLIRFARAIGKGQQVSAPEIALSELKLLTNTLVQMRNDLQLREQQLLEMSLKDSLTRLANRLAIEQKLPQWLAQPGFALIEINIAKFKLVNDSLGLKNGDKLLQILAERIKKLDNIVFSARLEADRFLLVTPQTAPHEVDVDEVIKCLIQPFDLSGSKISLRLIAGIYFPELNIDVNNALRRLGIALNNAKMADIEVAYYQQGQDEQYQREILIIRDLPAALSSGQFSVVYQPKVNIKEMSCTAAEALVRWHHPTLGFISPVEFILLAERTGNISMISDWVLSTVIQQLAEWRNQHVDLNVAVNLSAADFIDHTLPERIATLLQNADVPAASLSLELTESAVMQDKQQVLSTLSSFKQMGINLAIDDFGTGQSSLAYLKELPVDEVKIDRAFIKDIEHNEQDELIVQATVQLAQGLKLKVTAEGLENHSGLARVTAAGCHLVQGYYFSKPLAAGAFSLWLTNFNLDPWVYFPEAVMDSARTSAAAE